MESYNKPQRHLTIRDEISDQRDREREAVSDSCYLMSSSFFHGDEAAVLLLCGCWLISLISLATMANKLTLLVISQLVHPAAPWGHPAAAVPHSPDPFSG